MILITGKNFLRLILLHIGIGILIALYPFVSKIYSLLIVLTGLYFVIKSKNENNEILLVIAYIVGSEVFLRTTHGNPVYEYGKYSMVFFTFLGFLYSGIPKLKNPYWIYLMLFLPAIFFTVYTSFKSLHGIYYEIFGPVCLGLLALYTYKREISKKTICDVLNFIILPIIGTCAFLIINYSVNITILNSYTSNFYFSGGIAPNQMATILGLGFSIFFLKILIESNSKRMFVINLIILNVLFYRGLLTFSRGGIITGIIVILCITLAKKISCKDLKNIKNRLVILIITMVLTFCFTSYQTNSKILQRYALIDEKTIKKGGRYIQFKTDIQNFEKNPILGVGVGTGYELRKIHESKKHKTHIETTRMLSEHGVFGVLSLVLLIYYPLDRYRKDLKNIFILPFFVFWLLTINHSATRIAAPLFIYSLTLLKIKKEESSNEILLK